MNTTARGGVSRRHSLASTGLLLISLAAGALALTLAAVVSSLVWSFTDAGAAQAACPRAGVTSIALDEAEQPIGELQAWPLGLRCAFATADRGVVLVEPDFSLSFLAVAGLVLAGSSAAAGIASQEQRRLARHFRVLENRPSAAWMPGSAR